MKIMRIHQANLFITALFTFFFCTTIPLEQVTQDGKNFEQKQHRNTKIYYKAMLDTINREIARVSKSNKKRLTQLEQERKDVQKKLDTLERQSKRFNLNQ